MTALNFSITQRSDWSVPEPVVFQQHPTSDRINQNTVPSNKVSPITYDQNHLSNKPTETWSSVSPVLSGFIIGVLTGCLLLAVALPLWLTISFKTITTTTGKYLEIFFLFSFDKKIS